jgi:hypothetical protein
MRTHLGSHLILDTMRDFKQLPSIEEVEQRLNELGDDGWRLVAVREVYSGRLQLFLVRRDE